MKILLVCGAGMSSSMLMKKMEAYAAENAIEPFEINAVSVARCKDREIWQNYQCILLGPQVGFEKRNIEKYVEIPVEVMAPIDYGRQNCKAIFEQIHRIIG